MSESCCHPHPEPPAPVPPPRSARPWGITARFLGWFLGFSGLYAMGAVCPFCGRPGCPTGAASAGLVGVVFASLTQWGRSFRTYLARMVQR
ncbi:MAG: hypothetical protein ABSH53_02860 [Holophaga sp.]|jgi:hypothetical protein